MPPNKTSFRIAFCLAAISATFCFGSLLVLLYQSYGEGYSILQLVEVQLVQSRMAQGVLWTLFATAIWRRRWLAILPIAAIVGWFVVAFFLSASELASVGDTFGSPGLVLTFFLAMGLIPAILCEFTVRAWMKGELT